MSLAQCSSPVPIVSSESEVEVKLCNLPPFPDAATKLMRVTTEESVDLRTIKKVLASDPALGAEVLRLANSPLFAFNTVIHSVEHSITLMGLNRVRNLAVAIAMKSCWTMTHPAHQQCWAHGVASAVIAEELAAFSVVRKEDAFTAGLLHDIGRMGLLKSYPKEYGPLLQADYENSESARTAERWLMKVDHCMAGAYLAKAWDFPCGLQKIAEDHHGEAAEDDSLLAVIQISCLMADALGYPEISCQRRLPIHEVAKRLPPEAQRHIQQEGAQIRERIQNRLNYLKT